MAAHSDHGCSNCHVPHKAGTADDPDASWGVPLWSTAQTSDGLPTFTLYSSETFDALGTDIGQPDGPSKLCLGCHDGSYEVFDFIPDSEAIFGTESLATSHPVSFTYDSTLANKTDGELAIPGTTQSGLGGTIAHDLLDSQNKMQCTSCHDVHTTGIGEYLLRYDTGPDNENDQVLCRVCHNK
ncbi:MAG: cytochrome c3 family protein [Planctomycetota bacterium]